jgi:hypothetical protein
LTREKWLVLGMRWKREREECDCDGAAARKMMKTMLAWKKKRLSSSIFSFAHTKISSVVVCFN